MLKIKNSILFHELIWSKNLILKQCNNKQLRTVRSSIRSSLNSVNSMNNKLINQDSNDDNDNCNYLGININEDYSIINGDYVRTDKFKYKEKIQQKYLPLFKPKQKYNDSNKVRKKFNSIINVRFDSENQPKFHGEFEKNDELIFKTIDDVQKHFEIHNNSIEFIEPIKKDDKKIEIEFIPFEFDKNSKNNNNQLNESLIKDKLKFRYAELLSSEFEKDKNNNNNHKDDDNDWITYEQNKRKPSNEKAIKTETKSELDKKIMSVKFEPSNTEENVLIEPKTISGYEYLQQIHQGKRTPKLTEEFDVLKTLIRKEKLDTKGYRILTNQVPDYSNLTNDEIIKMLQAQILFNDKDIVAINKPYGIAVHGAFNNLKNDDNNNHNINYRIHYKYNTLKLNHFLPKLAEYLDCNKLYTVHRLDRYTTGVLLLTKTQEKANQLNELFKEQKILKKYLCITKNKPDILEGIIDIPIDLGYIKSSDNYKKRERMVLCPESVESVRLQRNWRTARKAITYYKVRSNNGNATLIEVTPKTGVRHQIRVHLGFGLRCPILGDHKYSNLDSLSPQKLPSDILMALKIRQSKTRNIPMHLHASLIMIPELGENGKNIFINAPLPYHFRQNLKSLKLTLN